ncbi:MAG: DUF4349 domain-containing protein, partial [Magnetococcus sp. WYHC-3]
TDYTTNASDRVVIYQAEVSLTVSGVRETFDRLRAMATSLRGYMQELSDHAIVLRVPASRLNEGLQQVEKMGEVTRRTIKGEDVTEEMRDLDIRLRNLDEMRGRLYALLAKGTNVQELLLVEKELERVTVDIETIKGRMLVIRTDVAYSTLTVTLNAAVPQAELREVMPFDWVRGLGEGIMAEAQVDFRPSQLSRTKLQLSWPSDYVRVAQRREEVRAMSGDGVTILVRRHENFENGTLAFWSPLVRRWLTASRILSIGEEKDFTGATGGHGRLFVADKTVGNRKIQYLIAIYCGEGHVYTYECWGPADMVTRDREALEKSIGTMEVE